MGASTRVVSRATARRTRLVKAWTHWATSADLLSLRLPAHDAGTGLSGGALGQCQHGASFVWDVFDAYGAGLVTNPNVVVAGSIGAGKSTVVKMQLTRALARGRRAVVVDPKGEYAELAARHGSTAIALGRDGWCSPFPDDEVEGRHLLRALIASAQGSALTDDQHFALDEVWQRLGGVPERVLFTLYELLKDHLSSPRASAQRSLALILHRFIHGDLAGLFDGDGAPLRLRGDLVVVDLSSQWSSHSLAVAVLSVVSAAQQVVGDSSAPGYLVIDEAWALMSDPASLRWLQGSWKLARARGLSHVIVLHRWSDIAAAGDAGSVERDRARGLLRECESAWLFRQPPDEAREMAVALGLAPQEERYLTALPKGVALVRYGSHRSIVRVEPNDADRRVIDTDAAMRAT
jgi:AAA domain-containing protein